MSPEFGSFRPERYARELTAIRHELSILDSFDQRRVDRILRRHPKDGSGLFSKSELVRGLRWLREERPVAGVEETLIERLRMKPVRTASGVAPVTVLTRPYPCPGRCIFCPSDVRMPKSYLSDEPGAQRAAQHRFDPYDQTLSRLRTYRDNGHDTDKVELIVLGGTWSFYPEEYQVWFIERCLAAMNDFGGRKEKGGRYESPEAGFDCADGRGNPYLSPFSPSPSFPTPGVDGRTMARTYNQIVSGLPVNGAGDGESSSWAELERAQRRNERAAARCVGLSLETRPDHLSAAEVLRLRRLGCTKVQIGYQSLSDEVLALNKRGHDVAATRRAMRLLRGAGFKIHAHWMPNLYGSSPARDLEDFERLFADPDFRPDELKIYPTSLIESAELMGRYEAGAWRPYSHRELLELLTACMLRTPEYCRLTRVIRDIPGTDIVAGNKHTNFREMVESELRRRGLAARDVRAREIRRGRLEWGRLALDRLDYDTSIGREVFLQYLTPERRLAAFLRLSLPGQEVAPEEIRASAMIREVHVYGVLVALGARGDGRSQHRGLGKALIERAAGIARTEGFADLAVISSIGTREYYRELGFEDGELYQHRPLIGRNGKKGDRYELPATE